jgi:thioredoxin 1
MEKLTPPEPSRDEVNTHAGATMLEFGASWCGYCQAAQATISAEMAKFATIRHLKIEDGKGRRLGRSFHVKLWPTLIFMRDGVEIQRLVRQIDAAELRAALSSVSSARDFSGDESS